MEQEEQKRFSCFRNFLETYPGKKRTLNFRIFTRVTRHRPTVPNSPTGMVRAGHRLPDPQTRRRHAEETKHERSTKRSAALWRFEGEAQDARRLPANAAQEIRAGVPAGVNKGRTKGKSIKRKNAINKNSSPFA